jgi:hypothetical protein
MENYVIHGKLLDSWGSCRDYVGIHIFVCEKIHDSWKTTWFMKNYMNHGQLADGFLVERNCANLWLHCQNIGIHTVKNYEKHCLNWEINDYYEVPS